MTIYPYPMVMFLGTVIVAGISGYMIGVTSSSRRLISQNSIYSTTLPTRRSRVTSCEKQDSEVEDQDEDEEIDDNDTCLDHAPNWENSIKDDIRSGLKTPLKSRFDSKPTWDTPNQEECKMVLVVRTDLGMTKGKIAAQCSHAAIACYKRMLFSNPTSHTLRKWEREGQTKIALQAKSEDELITLHAMALSLGLVAEIITDAGRTQIASGSQTVLGVGPAPRSIIDQVTGNLKLL